MLKGKAKIEVKFKLEKQMFTYKGTFVKETDSFVTINDRVSGLIHLNKKNIYYIKEED